MINKRPPFLFRLFGEAEAENDTFFFLKKSEVASVHSGMSALISCGKMTFGPEGVLETNSLTLAKIESKRIKFENKL